MSATILTNRLQAKLKELKEAKSKQNDLGVPSTWEAYRQNVGYILALEDCNKVLQVLLSEINAG